MTLNDVEQLLTENNALTAQIESNTSKVDEYIATIKEELKRVAEQYVAAENALQDTKYGGSGLFISTNSNRYTFSLSMQGELYVHVSWYDTWAYGGYDEGNFEFPYSLLVQENLDKYISRINAEIKYKLAQKKEEQLSAKNKEIARLLKELEDIESQ